MFKCGILKTILMVFLILPISVHAAENLPAQENDSWYKNFQPHNLDPAFLSSDPSDPSNQVHWAISTQCSLIKKNWKDRGSAEESFAQLEEMMDGIGAKFADQSTINSGYISYYYKDGYMRWLRGYNDFHIKSITYLERDPDHKFSLYPQFRNEYLAFQKDISATGHIKWAEENGFLRLDIAVDSKGLKQYSKKKYPEPKFITHILNNHFKDMPVERRTAHWQKLLDESKPWKFSHVERRDEFNVSYVYPYGDKKPPNRTDEEYLDLYFGFEGVRDKKNKLSGVSLKHFACDRLAIHDAPYLLVRRMPRGPSLKLKSPQPLKMGENCPEFEKWWRCSHIGVDNPEYCSQAPDKKPNCEAIE